MADVFFNGKIIGYVDNPKEFVENFKNKRRHNEIENFINISYDEKTNDIHIEASSGRLRRPLIIVKEGKPLLTEKHVEMLMNNELKWSDLVNQGIVEYLDAEEEENALVAFSVEEITPEHTHLEVSPIALFSLCTSLVPFSNYTQSARLNIGSKNQKQAIGIYISNYPLRMDMDVNILYYPQVPIVKTIMHDLSKYENHPAGQNVVLAVMSYKGYNMEDAFIINRNSIDMGLGRSVYYRPVIAEELRYPGGLTDEITIPDKDVKGYRSEHDYRYLESDGIIYPEAKVGEGDVLIGKVSPPRFLGGLEDYSLTSGVKRESSVALKHGEEGIVDSVIITENSEGNKLVQVKIRNPMIPEIGDKFTSRHGQKGVIGLIVDPSDMPFTASGIIPDIIFSPHSIPTRMTVAQLLELLGGKVGALAGRHIDATAFSSEREEDLKSQLLDLGFRDNGTETMYNGETGEMFKVRIFVGNIYYLRLKHLVANKLHARARGPVQLLTRQPTEGRAKEGGLRLGEMEKDCFVAHGTSLLLKERFDSDKIVIPVCEKCGLIAIEDFYKKTNYCPVCGEDSKVSFIEMSYAFKLLTDELKSMGVYPRFVLKTKY
ncbi:MAG: DNA-directed RNA polymerase subunit B [Candidatus Woesearchaeota archaeon]